MKVKIHVLCGTQPGKQNLKLSVIQRGNQNSKLRSIQSGKQDSELRNSRIIWQDIGTVI